MDTMQTDILLVYTERCHKTAMRREIKQLEAALTVAKKNEERPEDYPPLASFDEAIYGDIRESRGRINELQSRHSNLTARYIKQGKYVKMLTHRLREKHGEVAVEKLNEMIQELKCITDEYDRHRTHLQMMKMRYGVSLVQQCIAGGKKNPHLVSNSDRDYLKKLSRRIDLLVHTEGYRSDIKAIRSLIMDEKLSDDDVCDLGKRIADAYDGDDKLETNMKAIIKDISLYRQTVDNLRVHTLLARGD